MGGGVAGVSGSLELICTCSRLADPQGCTSPAQYQVFMDQSGKEERVKGRKGKIRKEPVAEGLRRA